jgi:hypothetical protein
LVNGHGYSRADLLALKTAFRMACEDVGSLDALAKATGCDKSQLSRYGSIEQSIFPPIHICMMVDKISGGDRCLKAIAHLAGYRLERDERAVKVECMTRHIGAVGQESGELISEMCIAVSDGKVTPTEAERIEREAQSVIDNAQLLQADCRRIRAA